MSRIIAISGLVFGCVVAGSVWAQNSASPSEAQEYATPGATPGAPQPRIDFKRLGISKEQAEQVKSILHEGHEYKTPPEAVRAKLSGVLNETQMNGLHQALEARRANAPAGERHPQQASGQGPAAGQSRPPFAGQVERQGQPQLQPQAQPQAAARFGNGAGAANLARIRGRQ